MDTWPVMPLAGDGYDPPSAGILASCIVAGVSVEAIKLARRNPVSTGMFPPAPTGVCISDMTRSVLSRNTASMRRSLAFVQASTVAEKETFVVANSSPRQSTANGSRNKPNPVIGCVDQ